MKTVRSTVKPTEWDSTSSPTTVYHNTNITEIAATDESPLFYEYEQEQYTPSDAVAAQHALRLSAVEEMQGSILLGMTDLYEKGVIE